MSIERARAYLKKFGIEERILEFDVSSATVDLAAQALACEPARIAKSLSFKIENRTLLVLAAGDGKIDNKKYKAAFGAKAKMLSPDEVVERIGHAVGGVCPFGINDGVEVYLRIGTLFGKEVTRLGVSHRRNTRDIILTHIQRRNIMNKPNTLLKVTRFLH